MPALPGDDGHKQSLNKTLFPGVFGIAGVAMINDVTSDSFL